MIIKAIFRLLSVVYGIAVTFAAVAARSCRRRLPVRLISVGNITVGGTGKTPLVETVARILREQGSRPAVVTRGYVLKAGCEPDEPRMLRDSLGGIPVIVDPDRVAGAREAMRRHGADTVILDDGFQQWRVSRDIDIVAIDATRPFGNRCVLPRGILREPLRALERADVFAVTKANLSGGTARLRDELARINPRALVIETHHVITGFCPVPGGQECLTVPSLRGSAAVAVSGIGDPDSFERLLESLGVRVAAACRFTDHHEFSRGDVDRIALEVRNTGAACVITTAKDAVRLARADLSALGCRVFSARLEAVIVKGEEELRGRLRKLCAV